MRKSFGFTLIELLIVIAVIAGLTSIVIFTFPASQGKGRDAKRMEELKQYQIAIETYATKMGGLYPNYTSEIDASSLCGATANHLGSNFPVCPKDQFDNQNKCSNQTCRYYYISNSSYTEYLLYASLEQPIDPTKPYYVVCSSGLSGNAAKPSNSSCPTF